MSLPLFLPLRLLLPVNIPGFKVPVTDRAKNDLSNLSAKRKMQPLPWGHEF